MTLTKNIIKYLLISISSLLLTCSFAISDDKVNDPVKIQGELFRSNSGDMFVAVSYQMVDHWHVYWKNPGDSGSPTTIEFEVEGEKIVFPYYPWPAPKKYMQEGEILAYGYDETTSIFFPISSEIKERIHGKELLVKSRWVACSGVCIPGSKSISMRIPTPVEIGTTDKFVPTNEDRFSTELTKGFLSLPKETSFPDNLSLTLSKSSEANKLILYYQLSGTSYKNLHKGSSLLTPYPLEPFVFGHEKLYTDKKNGMYGKVILEWEGEYLDDPTPLPTDGIFNDYYEFKFLFANPNSGNVEIIKLELDRFDLNGSKRFENLLSILTEVKVPAIQISSEQFISDDSSGIFSLKFLYFLLLGLIGGLILNLMPCVLPVISIKLFGLIKHREATRAKIFKHNLFYTLGVLFSMMVLAGTIVAIKVAGANVGWGFQLQSPTFVMIMIIVLAIFTLNLLGIFEFKTPGGKTLGGAQTGDSFIGDFLSGILAVILSTPCSAPFLGTALTFAFTSSYEIIFGVFFAIGIGLSLPFIITGIFPKMISFLPKPGNWMNWFKKFLAITLILTIVWLFDIFLALTSDVPAMEEGQTYTKEGLSWEKWSESRMSSLKDEGKTVFIDFTAKWCLTCKVNEKLVIKTDAFKALIAKHNLTLLLADWTKHDEKIGAWLKTHGKVGVPAYFIQRPDGTLIDLGETISISEIEKHL